VPIKADANYVLEFLSREPSAQRIAEMRREAEIMRKLDRAEAFAEGRIEKQRECIEVLSRACGIELDAEQRAELDRLDQPALDARFEELARLRARQ
jgi:hypothetical protein